MATKIEPTRTRVHGTQVTASNGDPSVKIAAVRRIVAECQYAKIDGMMVDLFTASAIVAVYDALNETNKATFSALPIDRMGLVALRLVK